MAENKVDGIAPYIGPAGDWGALRAVAGAVAREMGTSTDTVARGSVTASFSTADDLIAIAAFDTASAAPSHKSVAASLRPSPPS